MTLLENWHSGYCSAPLRRDLRVPEFESQILRVNKELAFSVTLKDCKLDTFMRKGKELAVFPVGSTRIQSPTPQLRITAP